MSFRGRRPRNLHAGQEIHPHLRAAQVDAGVRSDAAQALGQLGRVDEAAEVLLALARDVQVDAWVRDAAYGSLKAVLGGAQETGE